MSTIESVYFDFSILISINFALFFLAMNGIIDAGLISPVVPIKMNRSTLETSLIGSL
ncbi:MAG: hypothetical protein ACFFAH_12795 [Promethearchaeota archaeon]